jgi:hypothetical protein
MPATTAPTPGWPVTTNSPRRHHAVSGEGWNPTASRTMAILPAALGWHHAPPNPRRQAAGELGACYTTAARRRRRRTRATTTGRTRDDGPQHGGPTSRPDAPAPPPPNPHPSPNPAPGAALSTTLAGQGRTGVAAWAAMHTPAGFGRSRAALLAPAADAPSIFCQSLLTGTGGVDGSPTTACLNSRGGARASKGAYTFH